MKRESSRGYYYQEPPENIDIVAKLEEIKNKVLGIRESQSIPLDFPIVVGGMMESGNDVKVHILTGHGDDITGLVKGQTYMTSIGLYSREGRFMGWIRSRGDWEVVAPSPDIFEIIRSLKLVE